MDAGQGVPSSRKRRGKRSDAPPATAVATELVTLTVSESPVSGTIGTIAAEQGKQLTVECQIKRLGQLPRQMKATLEGLPNRVGAKPVMISAEDQRIAFTLELEPTAPVGSFPDLVCRLAGTIDGQEVSYCVGRGGILKIERSGGLVTDGTGRPLSPLEALRRSKQEVNDKKTSP